MKKQLHAVAIDGPSGAGKKHPGPGSCRAAALFICRYGGDLPLHRLVCAAEGHFPGAAGRDREAAARPENRRFYGEDGLQHMLVNGEDVTDRIRLPEVSAAASKVAAVGAVRSYLLEMQRQLAREHDVIMDGRDIGTVVLPDADCKIFLTASAEVRARRRCTELEQRGTPQTYETVLADMRRRDEQDCSRAVAPLKQAEDAVLLDTSNWTLPTASRRWWD